MKSRPSRKNILDLIPDVTPRWYELGIKLLNDDQESHLDIIKTNHSNDQLKGCAEMFWFWLSAQPDASWQQLIESLKSPAIQLHTVAANIEALFTGKYFSYVHMLRNLHESTYYVLLTLLSSTSN